MRIRTDDEVYRVDAVWLGPPRATFPWRARYSAYGVGLLVMIVVMFLQRRLGIDIGFFSIAWALLITVVVTRFVSHRINDERPLLEWLSLFVHELRGPRASTRVVGGALTTGHVRVRRDRPRLPGRSPAIPLPPGSAPADPARTVTGRTPSARNGGEHSIRPAVGVAAPTASPSAAHIAGPSATHPAAPAAGPAAPAAGPAARRAPASRSGRARPPRARRREPDHGGFGPPSSTEVGAPVRASENPEAPERPALPAAAPDAVSAAAVVDGWTRAAPPEREPVRARTRHADTADAGWGPAGGARGFGPGARRGGPDARGSGADDRARP